MSEFWLLNYLERVAYYAGFEGTLIGACSELLQWLLFPPFLFGFYCELAWAMVLLTVSDFGGLAVITECSRHVRLNRIRTCLIGSGLASQVQCNFHHCFPAATVVLTSGQWLFSLRYHFSLFAKFFKTN